MASTRSHECSRSAFGEAQWLKAGTASPWPPLFLLRTTLWTIAVCGLVRLVRSHMVAQNSSLTMRRSPWGTRTRGQWVWHRASILAKSHILLPWPSFEMPIGRGGARSFFHSADAQHNRYMRRFIPRDQGTVTGSQDAAHPELDASHHFPIANHFQSRPCLTYVLR